MLPSPMELAPTPAVLLVWLPALRVETASSFRASRHAVGVASETACSCLARVAMPAGLPTPAHRELAALAAA